MIRLSLSETEAEALLMYLERPTAPSLPRLCEQVEEGLDAQGRRRCSDCARFFSRAFRASWSREPEPDQCPDCRDAEEVTA